MGERGKKDSSHTTGNLRRRKDARREAAIARQEIYDGLTLEQKVDRLKERPGGAKKEWAKLGR